MLAVTLCFTAFIFINTSFQTARADTAIEKPYFSGGTTDIEKDWSANGNITVYVTFPSVRNISYTFKGNGNFNYFTETAGIITANSVGVCTLTFTPKEGYVWADDGTATPVTLTLTVKGIDIADAFEFREIEKYVYDGTEKKPTPTIWNKQLNGRMTEGNDFIYSGYSDNINAGEATITITGIGNYSGTLSTTFLIEKADFTPTITSPSTIDKAVGLTYSGNTSGGEASWSVEDGTGKATIDGSTLIPTQPGTVKVTLTITETENYNAAIATQTVTISKADINPDFTYPTVTVGNDSAPPSVTGVAGDEAITWSVSNGTGRATINQATGVLSPALAGTVEVTLTVAASTYYNEGSVTKTVNIVKPTPAVAITNTPNVKFGETLTLTCVGNDGNAVWTVENGTGKAEISGSALIPRQAGTVTVTLTVAETASFAAVTKTQEITIAKADISPDFTYSAIAYGRNSSAPQVTGNTGNGACAWTVDSDSGSALINAESGVLTPTLVGTVTVTLTVAESLNYNAGTATQTVTIEKGNITPVITSPATATFGEPLTLTFSGNTGGGEATWKVTAGTGTATVSNSVLTPTLTGTVVITLTIAETANYNGGTATQTVTIKELPDPDVPADPETPNPPQGGLSTAALVAVITVAVLAAGFATAAVIIAVRKKAGVSDTDGFYDDIDGSLK